MDLIYRNQLRELMEEHAEACVSMYMQTSRTWPETQTNAARLSDLTSKAKEKLMDFGFSNSGAQHFLERCMALLDNEDFWRKPSDGLAIFLSGDRFDYYKLPLDFRELVFVGNHFHIKPLVPLFSNDGRFYILSISQNKLRFLQGMQYKIGRIEPGDLSDNINRVLEHGSSERKIEFHNRTSILSGHQTTTFQGYGMGTDDSRDKLLEYFRPVNDEIHEILREEKAPLVFAGSDYLFSIYKEVNSYPNLMNEAVDGNPEDSSELKLQDRAWLIVQPYFDQEKEMALERYKEHRITEKASNDFEKIISAAYYGKIETLFVASDIQRLGVFDPDTSSIYLHQETQPGDYDLLDYAAVQTILNGGNLYADTVEHVPGMPPIAAVFRW